MTPLTEAYDMESERINTVGSSRNRTTEYRNVNSDKGRKKINNPYSSQENGELTIGDILK